MIKKMLIANRGEIAVRIIRASAEMGIRSVAIYTEADRFSLHVKQADESYCLGPESLEGYLNYHRIVNLAAMTHCDAIHPGVGFLSESAEFARACAQRNIIFVGPEPDNIALMGDKVSARKAMIKAGIPVIPGTDEPVPSLEAALSFAKEITYPVMLKASHGGGGRGIRLCHNDAELTNAFDSAGREAQKAFGNAQVYLEKAFIRPRHIEVQVLGDSFGNIVHLFERDCSIQRRHQKLIEIAPSPQLTQDRRKRVCQLAVKAAKAAKYQNAGTVEFLQDEEGDFYFLEMNTRLQVEHTVTEEITGIDLVKKQIEIACGLPIGLKQEEIQYRGIAADFRVNAEDPRHDFLPSFGRISKYYAPGGPGVRTDSAIYTGYSIPPYFDSMCAKVTIWALTWEELLPRAKRALREMRMAGIKTTIPYYLEILNHAAFEEAQFTTEFIEQNPELLTYSMRMKPHHIATVIAAALAAHLD